MIGPMQLAAAVNPTAKPGGYPSRFMVGISIEPIAAQSADAEPETPASIMLATTLTCAVPPRKCPTKAFDTSTMRVVRPPRFMITPDRMKNGTASSVNELIELSIRSATIVSGRPKATTLTMHAISIAVATGAPSSISTRKTANSSAISITPPAEAAARRGQSPCLGPKRAAAA